MLVVVVMLMLMLMLLLLLLLLLMLVVLMLLLSGVQGGACVLRARLGRWFCVVSESQTPLFVLFQVGLEAAEE